MVPKEEIQPYKVEGDGAGGAIELEGHGVHFFLPEKELICVLFWEILMQKVAVVQKVE